MAARSLLLFTELRSRETEELGVVEGRGSAPHRDRPGEAPLRALSEMQLRSFVYRGVISILRSVPPLRPSDWSQHPPWNVLIIVLRSHWGAGGMGAGSAWDSLQSVFPLSAFFFPRWKRAGRREEVS